MPKVIYEMGGVSTAISSGRTGSPTREFALIWQARPKVVFSRTLDSVEGANTTLARYDLRAELTSLQESVRGDVAVGGAESLPRRPVWI